MLSAIYDRICERLEATGLGAREAARLAGLNPDAIRNIRRGVDGERPGAVGVSTRTLAALAPVLGVTSAWLLEGSTEVESGTLPFVDWADVGDYLDPGWAFDGARRLSEQFGNWPAGYFATRAPDEAINRLAPMGAYLIVDRSDRKLVEGLCYLGVLDGQPLFRKWAAEPDRAEPFSTDPTFKTIFLSGKRRWEIIGRVRRAILEL
jgi:transcriptional regulator with XRE-family HTH domain